MCGSANRSTIANLILVGMTIPSRYQAVGELCFGPPRTPGITPQSQPHHTHTRSRTQTLLQRDGRVPAGVADLHPEANVRQQLRVVVDLVDGQEGRLDALDTVLLADLRAGDEGCGCHDLRLYRVWLRSHDTGTGWKR